jgi:uncharacterized membrane protein
MEPATFIFYIGAILAVGTFALKNVFHLRIMATCSGLCIIAYHLLTTNDMNPILLNALIITINIGYILKMRLNEREWKAIQRYKRIRRKKKALKTESE